MGSHLMTSSELSHLRNKYPPVALRTLLTLKKENQDFQGLSDCPGL